MDQLNTTAMVEEVATKIKPDSNKIQAGFRPSIAISIGEIAGIGPELALRCAADPVIRARCEPILFGPIGVLRRVASEIPTVTGSDVDLVKFVDDHAPLWIDVGNIQADSVRPGTFSRETGQAAYDAVVRAVDAAISGEVDAIVTGPIQKEAWHAAGIAFPGHTELLAAQTGTDDFRMMLSAPEISCALVTIHIPLADVAQSLSIEAIVRTIHLAAEAVRYKAKGDVRVTVCGLNPHAGENGLFSHGEERDIIEPAIIAASAKGIRIIGPVPPDTAFTPRMRAMTDVYVCMYHDQGLIPLKAIAFDDGVNVTLGLPIIRTSVDHGTALDIAWKGIASHSSMIAAINMAIDMSHRKLRDNA
jgi:4-phospho-D-threonate 3-dehydrogenase / 4-phospho-D-erythronate 3-dehydrogenase